MHTKENTLTISRGTHTIHASELGGNINCVMVRAFAKATIISYDKDLWIHVFNKADVTIEKRGECEIQVMCHDHSRVRVSGDMNITAYHRSKVYVREGKCHVSAYNRAFVLSRDTTHVIAKGRTRVDARGESRVLLCEKARGEVRDCSHTELRDKTQVSAYNNAVVTARGKSKVWANNSASVMLLDNAKGFACDSSDVTAYDNAIASLLDSAEAELYGNSTGWIRSDHVRAEVYEEATVEFAFGVDDKRTVTYK